ncbi:hypothetical protein INT45_008274 [Circinella minor]|uniref:Uncharacterized protein n=1 Tax=Circinella minor TaxID=1195481 RepID=A0A8H7VNL9_9FUNG|nr:hypothetical protein INT45_008274 [Circinella minor]
MSTSKRTSNRLSQRSPDPVVDLDTFERERRQRQREQRKVEESGKLGTGFTFNSKTAKVTDDKKEEHGETKDSKFDNDNHTNLPECIRDLFEEITSKKQLYEDLYNYLNMLMQVDNQALNTVDDQDKKLSKHLHELYQELVKTTNNNLSTELFKRTSDTVVEIINRLPKDVAKDE